MTAPLSPGPPSQVPNYRGTPITEMTDADLDAAYRHVCRVQGAMILEMTRRGMFRHDRKEQRLER